LPVVSDPPRQFGRDVAEAGVRPRIFHRTRLASAV